LVDAKVELPSACNAVEVILFHKSIERHQIMQFIETLRKHKVEIYGGPNFLSVFYNLQIKAAPSLSHEYSDLGVTFEIIESVDEAINHINSFGSSHTDAIITENQKVSQRFLSEVDSASVFHNCSTRFADGYRYGLGAEIGISTSRIHARGPVGILGLMTTKYILLSSQGHIVSEFSNGCKQYTHKNLFVSKL